MKKEQNSLLLLRVLPSQSPEQRVSHCPVHCLLDFFRPKVEKREKKRKNVHNAALFEKNLTTLFLCPVGPTGIIRDDNNL
jgi:hypothetical protein